MNHWLLKSDPETYGLDDLERDKKTVWDGVRNNQALQYMRQMKKGDAVLIYHSGDDKCILCLAEVARGPYSDPKETDEKLVVIDLVFKRRLPTPVTLAQIKADARFSEFALVRLSRLSVMPVPEATWDALCTMAGL